MAVAAVLVAVVALFLGAYWWLSPVVSPRQAGCGSVRDPGESVAATYFNGTDRSPCGQAFDDQARLVHISIAIATGAVAVLIAVVAVPARKPTALPGEWPERRDDDILRA